MGSGQGCPLLRASDEHRFIVRILRARRAPGRPSSSRLARFPLQGWELIELPLRASNEDLLKPHVARRELLESSFRKVECLRFLVAPEIGQVSNLAVPTIWQEAFPAVLQVLVIETLAFHPRLPTPAQSTHEHHRTVWSFKEAAGRPRTSRHSRRSLPLESA